MANSAWLYVWATLGTSLHSEVLTVEQREAQGFEVVGAAPRWPQTVLMRKDADD